MRTILAVALFAALTAPALAGDTAEREILGFSPDGNYFAFEEFGVQDGSGFPYSNIFFIETATDSWLADTPIRVRTDDESALLADTRFEAREQAQPILAQYAIGSPSNLVASNPPTELSADPHLVRFLPRVVFPPVDQEWTVTIEETQLPARNCPDFETYRGFRLTLTGADGQARILNDDTSIPDSRACPLGYAVADVVTFYPEGSDVGAPPPGAPRPVLAILISVISVGFEGPNRRFLAVTTRL
jgi:predicted secreted protein